MKPFINNRGREAQPLNETKRKVTVPFRKPTLVLDEGEKPCPTSNKPMMVKKSDEYLKTETVSETNCENLKTEPVSKTNYKNGFYENGQNPAKTVHAQMCNITKVATKVAQNIDKLNDLSAKSFAQSF